MVFEQLRDWQFLARTAWVVFWIDLWIDPDLTPVTHVKNLKST